MLILLYCCWVGSDSNSFTSAGGRLDSTVKQLYWHKVQLFWLKVQLFWYKVQLLSYKGTAFLVQCTSTLLQGTAIHVQGTAILVQGAAILWYDSSNSGSRYSYSYNYILLFWNKAQIFWYSIVQGILHLLQAVYEITTFLKDSCYSRIRRMAHC